MAQLEFYNNFACKYCKTDSVRHNISVINKDNDDDYIIYCNIITNDTFEKLFHHIYYLIDTILNNTDSNKYTLVFDSYNIGIDYLTSIPDIISGITIMKENFPERLKKLILINSNGIVTSIFENVKYLLNERIQNKIVFLDDINKLKEFNLEHIIDYIRDIDYDDIKLINYPL